MNRLYSLLAGSILLAASAAAAGFAFAGVAMGIFLAAAWLGFWLVSLYRQFKAAGAGVGSFALLGYVVLTMYAVAAGVWAGWMLFGMVAALAAWDLEFFILRMRDVQEEELIGTLILQHVRWLAMVVIIGLLLTGAAAFIHFTLSFGLALGISLLAVLIISRFVAALRQPRA